MPAPTQRFTLGGQRIPRGTTRDIRLKVSERYTGDAITLPIRVIRGRKPGPTLFVSAAVHGEELNGVGVIHQLMFDTPLPLNAGTLILIPVVNIFGFENQSRYMPDRRDLNRSFPGKPNGSLASRIAHQVFQEIITKSDYGIDLHTAAGSRTNFPNVRGDLNVTKVRRFARAFGCELMVHGRGPEGSLRREAVKAGCAVITIEAGEPLKIEPRVLEAGVRGVRNCLIHLDMMTGKPVDPPYQVRIDRSTWIRAEVGGILRFHVAPGEVVETGQAIATNVSVYGEAQNILHAPAAGIVLGMTTLPTVKPGEPVCHLAIPKGATKTLQRIFASKQHKNYQQIQKDLATNVTVSEQELDVPNLPQDDDNT
ncbi:succinylglutamate desuccinylase/aspartoacylase family protein [Mucisphaera calidilacus]|uniref:Succinylglutamate desuccinylase / Aspartoacylase family protein n=1 Tax=Mucisphaera calidilacus TaxID=2527982 RepID=A0A518BYR5_9BACT|nr:succinylglutamate desuccinylase/aspartoacylase family protein [Mucisphaera calidilacus]QDU72122.1 Succinylglutamate desuccinylase / Aspartoacylase family protein [Mucisphaera calidilacus]